MRISRKTGAVSGFMLVVLGLWGGLVPLIGPYFGYAFGSHATWDLTMNRFWLDVLPGGVVLIGGMMLMWSGHRVSGTLASWMAMAGGAWFAVGPPISRLWEHGPGPIGVPLFGHTRQTFELIGYFYGLGIVVMGLAAFALGRVVTRQAMAVAQPGPVLAAPVTDEPMTAEQQPMTAGNAPAPAGNEPVVESGSPTEPMFTRRRPITGGSDPNAPTTQNESATTTESERVHAHH